MQLELGRIRRFSNGKSERLTVCVCAMEQPEETTAESTKEEASTEAETAAAAEEPAAEEEEPVDPKEQLEEGGLSDAAAPAVTRRVPRCDAIAAGKDEILQAASPLRAIAAQARAHDSWRPTR